MPEYFPLRKNLRLEYKYTSSEFEGAAKVLVEILEVSENASGVCAQARMTVDIKGTPTSIDYRITRTAKWLATGDGIVTGGRKEFQLPVKVGLKWDDYPDANEIVSLSEKVSVPAGRFSKCLKIITLLSGGDSGTSTRLYAPGVGYVYEKYSGEDMQAEVKLISVCKGPATPVSRRKR